MTRDTHDRPPRVYLHIGEPKTGTTFLQHAIWGNRARLARQGILLPGYTRRDHSRASRDLRGAPRMPGDPVDPWDGEWDVLARQALKSPVAAIISDELLGNCSQERADRAVRSLEAAELHVVLTVRDFASLLPAEWQEAVKCRRTVRWEEWLGDVSRLGSTADRHDNSGFWAAHDTLATLSRWSQHLPPDRIHVITMPRDGSPDALWHRFAAVVGIDSAKIDLSQARGNTSLGLAETEFLRRMNETLSDEMPDWYYTRYIKQILAHDVLTNQPRRARVTLPPTGRNGPGRRPGPSSPPSATPSTTSPATSTSSSPSPRRALTSRPISSPAPSCSRPPCTPPRSWPRPATGRSTSPRRSSAPGSARGCWPASCAGPC